MKVNARCKIAALAACLVLLLSACTGNAPTNTSTAETAQTNEASGGEEYSFSYWNENDSLTALVEYVAAVTDESSADFIPVEDRIAVFDLDGTLVGEQAPIYFEWMMYCERVLNDDSYEATAEQIEAAGRVLYAAKEKSIPEGLETELYRLIGEAYAGMTVEEYRAYAADFLETDCDLFEGLVLKDSQFLPMLELVRYLQDNEFTVYVVSGSDRDICRVMISEKANIPYYNFICSDYWFTGEGQGDEPNEEYQPSEGEEILRTEEGIIKNIKMSKILQMQQELGQQPVLAFGNSTGDFGMFMYTTDDNPYRAEAFCIIPDDDEREFAYPEKAATLTSSCEENGWHMFSMKEDFKTIYGENVTKNTENTAWMDGLLAIYEAE